MSSSGSIVCMILFIWPRLLPALVLRFLATRWPPLFQIAFVPVQEAPSTPCVRGTGANARYLREDFGEMRSPHNSVAHTRAASESRGLIRPIFRELAESTARNQWLAVWKVRWLHLPVNPALSCAVPRRAASARCHRDKCEREPEADSDPRHESQRGMSPESDPRRAGRRSTDA